MTSLKWWIITFLHCVALIRIAYLTNRNETRILYMIGKKEGGREGRKKGRTEETN